VTAGWIALLANRLNSRRLRVHAGFLALCLWGVCLIDYSTPGVLDRAGNIKFQDFLQFPVSARLIAGGRAGELYRAQALTDALRALAGPDTRVRLQYFYGPQVALPFIPLLRFSFLTQSSVWVALSMLLYFACIFLLWKSCGALHPFPGLIALCAIAYPPLFHFFVRGQISAWMLACFTAAYLAFWARRDWLAGIALGFLFVKPQFLAAVPVVLLLARAWRPLVGLVASVAAQVAFVSIYFGRGVLRAYFAMLLHSAGRPGTTELDLSPIQMHSLRSFWALLIPSSPVVWILYLASSMAVLVMAAALWKSSLPLSVRFSSLLLAAVLVNPHLYIYDLLALAPALLLLADWTRSTPQDDSSPAIRVLLYLSFSLPLFGPVNRWTHLQVSVVAFTALLCLLWRLSRAAKWSGNRKLAPSESGVV